MLSTEKNQSGTVTFILLGFSDNPELQVPLFLVFLAIYSVTVLGNLGMIVIIRINPKLHTPMYFFLSHLSFVDFCYSTVVTPKLLENLAVADRTISFQGCITQFFFACTFVVTETFMLAVMAYDRVVAISNPLMYTVAMSQTLCILLVTGAYAWGIISSLVIMSSLLSLSFCRFSILDNFVCEYSVILSASCSDTYITEMLLFIFATFNEVSSLVIILTSYLFILTTVLQMNSVSGRHKAFSTCTSHFMAITIYHGTILFLYCLPRNQNLKEEVKVASVFYTVVIPMLNPLIYSLRNKDVKEAVNNFKITKILSQSIHSH
ncbi:olfactory receptor 5D18-like [Phascolarctos cinereus]|uniref:Olfactory receptor 5D18-like n=1 Tax=Phascolarctos cinereus TaxID=38626 RepID=A0A6P5J6Y2_PHACI|nr:olfactory receptor 5D18-like [Phascolarctos cinereus]